MHLVKHVPDINTMYCWYLAVQNYIIVNIPRKDLKIKINIMYLLHSNSIEIDYLI